MKKLEEAIKRTMTRLAKQYAEAWNHQGYEALAMLLVELEGSKLRKAEGDQAGCLHRCRRLGLKARPYRYECTVCGKRLKIASGVVLEEREATT